MAKYLGESGLSELVSKTKNLVDTKQDILTSKGSSTKPIYISSSGTISECSTFAGGTSITLNGTSKSASTASFYAPTSAVTTSTAKRYLLGSSSTTSVATENTNSSCFMSGGKLFSNGTEVQEKLVSGTSIKTINGASLLGSGDLTLSGGGVSTDVQVDSTSITSGGVANLKTVGGNYDASSNKLLTKNDLLDQVYPVGSIYLTVSTSTISSSPASWLGGTWTRLPEGYALWTASSGAYNGSSGTISAGLPNIKGSVDVRPTYNGSTFTNYNGALSAVEQGSSTKWTNGFNYTTTSKYLDKLSFAASSSNSIYSDSVSTVQPPAIKVYAWRRTA